MNHSRRMFILTEAALAAIVLVLAGMMFYEHNKKDVDKISVIVQNSDDNQWSAFKYGLKMAARDWNIEAFVVSTGPNLTAKEQKTLIEQEIENGADGVIIQPIAGEPLEDYLDKVKNRIPVMLVDGFENEDFKTKGFAVAGQCDYEMGTALAEELLKDYSGYVSGKTMGIVSLSSNRSATLRMSGVKDLLEQAGIELLWTVSESDGAVQAIAGQKEADFIIALDNASLIAAGSAASENNLHGALVYGIGSSTEAVYYLDRGNVRCLIVPDGFDEGYQSLEELVKSLSKYIYKMKDITVSYTVLRKNELFTKENQEIIFTMSQ